MDTTGRTNRGWTTTTGLTTGHDGTGEYRMDYDDDGTDDGTDGRTEDGRRRRGGHDGTDGRYIYTYIYI